MHPYRAFNLAFVMLAGAWTLASGCAEGTESWASAPELGEYPARRFALVSVTHEASTPASMVDVTAQFVEYQGPDDRWAMRALDVWLPPGGEVPVDTCTVNLEPFADSQQPTPYDVAIQLLDAGNIAFVHGFESTLDVYSMPGMQTYLSGVFYDLSEAPIAASDVLQFIGSGGAEVDAFRVAAVRPQDMRLVAVDGIPRGSLEVLMVPDTRDLLIEWRAPTASDTATGGGVYFDLYDDARSAAPLVSCVALDDGLFRLPADALGAVVAHYPDAALRLVTRRASLAELALRGFDWAKVVVTSSDVLLLSAAR